MNQLVLPTLPSSRTSLHIVWIACLLATLFFHSFALAAISLGVSALGGKQVLFIEDNVADYQQFLPADAAAMDVVILDSKQDGLRQIAASLEGRRSIAGVHLISHGGPGTLGLGSLRLGSVELGTRAADMGTIRAALQRDADIFLYGCNVAAGDAGQRFIRALADATGARVAASTNLTGASDLGGDWVLESRTGALHSKALAFPAYRAVLPTVAGTVALPFGHPDSAFRTATMIDGQANTGTTDIAGIVYQFYFANTGNTQTGTITNIDLAGGTGSVLLFFDNGTNQYGPVGAMIIKSQSNRLFGMASFRIQDAQGLSATYTATGYRNNAVVGVGYNFNTGGNFNPVTITLPVQFKNVDEVRITSNGGVGGVGAQLWQEGFNSFVFIDPTTNADLAALSASAGTLVPAFSASTTGYSFTVGSAVASTTITPTVDIPGSTVKVNNVTVASGAASGAIGLGVGTNTITTVVTAPDGATTKTYSITVTRTGSTNANLSALSLWSGTLAPAFASATTGYTASVGNATTSLTVTPTVADVSASVTVNGVAVTSGNASGAIALAVGSNTITTVVTAQDGTTTKTYTVTVTRAASSNADLSALSLSSGTLAPAFASATTGYTASVGNATTSLTVTPTVSAGASSVTVNGVAVTSGNASGAIALNVGSNTITTVVTAQDGITTKTYTVTVTRAASSNADLSALGLSSGTLAPAFASATTGYTASVGNATTSLTVTPTVSAGTSSVTVNGVAVTSGNASGAIALNVGSNTITTVVTAQDGLTTKTYTVTVSRAASSNADLSALSLSSGTLAPAFASATTGYTASVGNATTSLTVTPTVSASTSSVTVNGVSVVSGSASAAIALNVGSNTITTVVMAQDGLTTKTYTVTVTRAASSNADLSALSLSSGTLAPAFASATTGYTASVGNATTSLTVTPTVSAGTSSVTVNAVPVVSGSASGAIALNVGSNTITTVVTAQDGTIRTYTVTVTRAASSNANLSAVSISSGTLAPAFASATTSYAASVGNATTSLTLTATVSDNTASVAVNGVATASASASGPIALNVGSNTITTVVTAQDGTTKTYTVTVTRAASSNADLNALSLSSGTLGPAFASATTSYTAIVGNATTSLTVTPTVSDSTASVAVNGVSVVSGSASGAIALNVGSTTITTAVTGQDGTTKTYTVTLTRAASTNADLGALSMSSGTLSPAFASGTTGYTASVGNATTSVTFTPTALAGTSGITVNGVATASGATSAPIALYVGSNTISMLVTAQDGITTKAYSVTVTRATSANAALSALSLSGGTLSPAFSATQFNYSASVPNATASITVTPTVVDSTASATVNGVAVASGSASAPIPLVIGSNNVTIVVTAQNGSTTSTTIALTRTASPSTSSIGGQVYVDASHDGIKDGAESGLAGATVKLSGTDNDGAAVDLSTVSSADGSFAFASLKGGAYTLTQVQPAGVLDGRETAGSLGGTVENSSFDDSAARNQIANIVVAGGQNATGYLFGEQSTGNLQGFVYVDANNNGLKDNAEAGLAGIRVTLSPISGGAARIATSGADGSFAFPGVTAGTYALSRNAADGDGAVLADGMERAGVAGGVVNSTSFGTQPHQLTITQIRVDAASIVAASGNLDGYLFGLRPRGVPGLKLPIVGGAVMLSSKPTPGHNGGGLLAGWNITLLRNSASLCSVASNAQGQYQIDNLACPGYAQTGLPTGSGFSVQFNKPGSNLTGMPMSGGDAGTETPRTISGITLSATDDISQQNLPLDPEGVVYDAVSRQALAGATVVISGPPGFDPATHLVGGAVVQRQVTGSDGAYQYLLQNGYPTGVYSLAVTQAPPGYSTTSALLPACNGTLNVGATPDPAFIQFNETAPPAGNTRHDPGACSGLVAGGATSTQYYLNFLITNAVSAPILNNHIPLDAAVATGLVLSKSGDRQTAEMGDTVRYTIALNQGAGASVLQASVRDVLPAGFRFIPGTVTVNGVRAADPAMGPGAVLVFNLGASRTGVPTVLGYRLRVGVGSMQGDGVNRAIAYACNNVAGCLNPATLAALAGSTASNEASFKVKVTGGVFTSDACVAGKVFTDCNRNGVQDTGERGIPAVRLYLEDGTHITTDTDGKYSYCGLSPMAHVIKLDTTTMPAGSVLGETSNRNLGDPGSVLLDVKNGELIRADFAETSCTAPVLDGLKLRTPIAAPPPGASPGITFSSKVNSKVNSSVNSKKPGKQPSALPAKGEHHAQ